MCNQKNDGGEPEVTVSIGFQNIFYSCLIKVIDEGFFHQVKMLQPAALELELRSLTSLQSLNVFMQHLFEDSKRTAILKQLKLP